MPELPPPPVSSLALLPLTEMPVGLQIFLEPTAFERCKDIARYLAGATGFVPSHLQGNQFACFAVVSRALTWKLDPFAVIPK